MPLLTDEQRAAALLIAKRRAQEQAAQGKVDAILAELFDRQQDFHNDTSRFKAALCTRRAGKTSMWARTCTVVAVTNPRVLIRIWGITRLRAKQLLWDEFRYIFARHGISTSQNETELTIKFANGSEIRLVGADKDKEVQKKRGDKTKMEVVLEAQLYGPILKSMVEDVIEPCLFDLNGILCLEGTPGLICAGYWFDVSGRDDISTRWQSIGGKEGVGANWSCHRWGVLDNPHLRGQNGTADARVELEALKKRRRWNNSSPTYVREWLAQWVNDWSALYYAFDERRNTFSLSEVKPWGPGWVHVLGWDLGARDDMALVVWGFHPSRPELYEAFSWKKPGALSEEVIGVVRGLEEKGVDGVRFNIVRRFADTGGGGKMYVDDVASRTGMSFEAAKKTEKFQHVMLMNDDYRSGFIKLQVGSPLQEEVAALPKDPDWPPPEKPEAPPREDPRFPNHCCDAGLYSWRGGWHYLHETEVAPPAPGTEEWMKAEARRMEQALLDEVLRPLADNANYWLGED